MSGFPRSLRVRLYAALILRVLETLLISTELPVLKPRVLYQEKLAWRCYLQLTRACNTVALDSPKLYLTAIEGTKLLVEVHHFKPARPKPPVQPSLPMGGGHWGPWTAIGHHVGSNLTRDFRDSRLGLIADSPGHCH
ncbi:hypothetical protein BO70DRAFT_364114 [Aspergillus heteromorphus CBS 117.55]|uniref:Uncharacterized protein n=1 Tax=Aspergillus heteromorphus CBS 117.55 TaxID=1448321 RepID=A0A317VMB0_9EURO|nr:uncharacterized protein BO70DRAFT_364114 [Aspergillus heteromorphus CBS 117.55]PWY75025.1 hypothetical protein BO70DRAFT_364114 [Aspergillus heteromorphus CBS 117.55]